MARILSWNVNGIRACVKNGFMDWLGSTRLDVLCLQETRATLDQIPPQLANYDRFNLELFDASAKKGYSGVAILSKKKPAKVWRGMDAQEFDVEGRVISALFEDFVAVSAYFPNSQDAGKRIDYKSAFCKKIHQWVDHLRKDTKKPVVLAGDYNIAHHEIDLARPDDNHNSAGFLPAEREWMDEFTEAGWVDSFRELNPKSQRYSWWSARTRARERNVGWRIDYHCVHRDDVAKIKGAEIHEDVMGSDHCPVSIRLG